jgi:molybdate transport system permease protein
MTSRRDSLFLAGLVTPLVMLGAYLLTLMVAQGPFFEGERIREQLSSPDILFAVKLSVGTATVSALLALAVALPSAYLLSRWHFPGKRLLDTFLDLPMVLTPIALGTLILMALNTGPGMVLEQLGLTIPYTLLGVIAAQFTVVVAMAVRMLKASFDEVSPRYEQVARTLGCSAMGAFFRVSLPMVRSGLVAAFVLTWARAIGEFGATVMVAGTARGKTATLPTSIYLAMASADLGRAVVLISLLMIVSFFVLLILRLVAREEP